MNTRMVAVLGSILLAFSPQAGAQAPSDTFPTTPFTRQNEYIEASILKDVALMLQYAKSGKTSPVEVTALRSERPVCSYQLSLLGKLLLIELELQGPIWEPSRYDVAVMKIAAAVELESPRHEIKPEGNVIHELENPRIDTLAGLSENISRKLQEQMLDPALQEQAALLLAAFALRERIEPYDDVRWALNRLTAHLVVARWSSGARQGLDGRYALTSSYILMGLQTNALGRLRELEKDPLSNAVWNRALLTRITGDHRPLAALPVAKLSLLEWAERVAALRQNVSDETALKDAKKFVKTNGAKDFNSDVFFCIFHGYKPESVSIGRGLYLESGLPFILKDVAAASRAVRGNVFPVNDGEELALRLNVEPGLCVHPEGQVVVLDWGAWAMQFQRRLAVYKRTSIEFMRDSWNLPVADIEQAKQTLDKLLGRLWLTQCFDAGTTDAKSFEAALQIFTTRPQVVPSQAARNLGQALASKLPRTSDMNDPLGKQMGPVLAWCSGFPRNTFANLTGTFPYMRAACDLSMSRDIAPFNITVVRTYVALRGRTPAETRAAVKDLAEYNTYAGHLLADSLPSDQIAAKTAIYQKLAAVDPNMYFTLFDLFIEKEPAKAVEYYEKARSNGADPVWLANTARPVVLYYLSINDELRAKVVAQEADECASSAGFEAMQIFCIKVHDFKRGLQAAQDEEERYQNPHAVAAYIAMVKKEQPAYHEFDELYQQKLARFNTPAAPAYVTTTEPPRVGVRLLDSGKSLRRGDIVVALNGRAVQDIMVLRVLRRDYTAHTGEADAIPMTVYRRGKYLEVKDTTADLGVAEFTGGGLGPVVFLSATREFFVVQDPNAPPGTSTEMAYLMKLRLSGISGTPSKRLAIINGKTLAEGESAAVNVGGHNFTVHCLSIREDTVQLRVDGPKGGTAELQLTMNN